MNVGSFTLLLSISILLPSCSGNNSDTEDRTVVVFPGVSEPIQITEDGKEHLFASYYGINLGGKRILYYLFCLIGKVTKQRLLRA